MASRFPPGFAPDVIAAKPLRGYRLWLRFVDGNEGTADLSEYSPKKAPHPLWRSMREFRQGEAKYDTVSWPREDGRTLEMSPFSLYVRAGLATWEELNDPGDAKPRTRATSIRDCKGGGLWVELDSGHKGYVKPARDLSDCMEEFTLPDRHGEGSYIVDSGDIVWKNEFWIAGGDVESLLEKRRNGRMAV